MPQLVVARWWRRWTRSWAAGPELLAECRMLGGCATGQEKSPRATNVRPGLAEACTTRTNCSRAVSELFRLVEQHGIKTCGVPHPPARRVPMDRGDCRAEPKDFLGQNQLGGAGDAGLFGRRCIENPSGGSGGRLTLPSRQSGERVGARGFDLNKTVSSPRPLLLWGGEGEKLGVWKCARQAALGEICV